MKKTVLIFVGIISCICLMGTVQTRHSAVSATVAQPIIATSDDSGMETDVSSLIGYNGFDSFRSLKVGQQVGMQCSILPRCPDCNGSGNVCFGAEEFFPGITVLAKGKSLMVTKCRKANALDYCGGSRECVKKTRQEQQKHRSNYGGGCYAQCQEKNVYCVLTNR